MSAKSFTRHIPTIARLLYGLMFFVFGLNGFLNFIPQPKTMPDAVVAVMTGFMSSHYMMPLIFGTQVTTGVLLLANRFVPLALALIAPVVVNIFCFHVFLSPEGLVIACVVVLFEVYLAWAYRKAFLPMLAAKVTPA